MTALAPRRSSVLIVDDSPGVLLAMEKLLSPYLTVKVADSAAAALKHLTPDTALVLTDVRMPDMDGLELTRALRQKHPKLPVVFMTGIVEDSLRSEARALGVLDVLRKPLKPGVLLPALQDWLDQDLALPLNWEAVPSPQAKTAGGSPTQDSATAQAHQAATQALRADKVRGDSERAGNEAATTRTLPPLTSYLNGIHYLPGVMIAAAFDPQGQRLNDDTHLPEQIGAYVRFLCSSTLTLGTHIQADTELRAVQIEFPDRVLVVVPAPNGFLVVVVRDTPAASSVKAWLRTHLREGSAPHLN